MQTKEEKIRSCFTFYQTQVLPEVEKWATQTKEGFHGLYTHTHSVVFRAIDYALELNENPVPALFAAACHDMARTDDAYETEHGPKAVPLAQKVMAAFPDVLSPEQQKAVCYAIAHHTQGEKAPDYVSACLWDADRTRLSWIRGYQEKFFNTAYAKKVAAGDRSSYTQWQNKIIGQS